MSRALERLREMFDDELLIRTNRGSEPTHRALHLCTRIQRLMPHLNGLLRVGTFAPVAATETFKITASDYSAIVLLPLLMARVGKLAPKVTLRILPWDDTVIQRLRANALDLALGAAKEVPNDLRTQVLFREEFVCLVRRGHPLAKKPLTLDRYLSYPHAALTGTKHLTQAVDRALKRKGLRRQVQLMIPYFVAAPWSIARSDIILTLSKRLAQRLAKVSHTKMLPLPFDLPPFDYAQIWHPRLDSDPAHQWLRRMIAEVSVTY